MKKYTARVACLILIFTMVGCSKTVRWNGETEIFAELLMVEDVSDNYVYAGLVDNIFVGTVEKIDRNIISENASHEDSYSIYEIRVDQNLKGNLTEHIVCSKLGGLRKDGTMLVISAETNSGIFVDSGMPEMGKRYIFLSYSQPDGSITLSELFDHRECDEKLIDEYRNYVENQVEIERERFVSKYEKQ